MATTTSNKRGRPDRASDLHVCRLTGPFRWVEIGRIPQEIRARFRPGDPWPHSLDFVAGAKAVAESDQIGRLGVMYVRSLLAQAGVVHNQIPGGEDHLGSVYDVPMGIIELSRACAHMVDDLGPYSRDGFTQEEPADVSAMGDAELITALQQALGEVCLFNMMDADG